jgi:2-C-methyl-D-erythritol 4-phosphate cytidylyltransferase
MLIERLGMQVKVVEGDYSNVKITTPEDLIYAEFITTRNNKGELTND